MQPAELSPRKAIRLLPNSLSLKRGAFSRGAKRSSLSVEFYEKHQNFHPLININCPNPIERHPRGEPQVATTQSTQTQRTRNSMKEDLPPQTNADEIPALVRKVFTALALHLCSTSSSSKVIFSCRSNTAYESKPISRHRQTSKET
ncbi:hypothetical protein Taro_038180 [Colocasia esculenta]|uniref:Uncharacterized protein n=1 Tax=Colocasia esculenta TaxID=4460 RepID=A0A843WLG2_COLES|nr:hypothetical protein [Colocasia esculenta]